MSAEQVRSAYRTRGWAFTDPQQIEQCAKEGYVTKLREQAGEGCHMWGELKINKVSPCRAAAHQRRTPFVQDVFLCCDYRVIAVGCHGMETGTGPSLVSSMSRAPDPAQSWACKAA